MMRICAVAYAHEKCCLFLFLSPNGGDKKKKLNRVFFSTMSREIVMGMQVDGTAP
jgi:hypothetical protein